MTKRKGDEQPEETTEDEEVEGAGRWTTDEATGDRRWVPEGSEESS